MSITLPSLSRGGYTSTHLCYFSFRILPFLVVSKTLAFKDSISCLKPWFFFYKKIIWSKATTLSKISFLRTFKLFSKRASSVKILSFSLSDFWKSLILYWHFLQNEKMDPNLPQLDDHLTSAMRHTCAKWALACSLVSSSLIQWKSSAKNTLPPASLCFSSNIFFR